MTWRRCIERHGAYNVAIVLSISEIYALDTCPGLGDQILLNVWNAIETREAFWMWLNAYWDS